MHSAELRTIHRFGATRQSVLFASRANGKSLFVRLACPQRTFGEIFGFERSAIRQWNVMVQTWSLGNLARLDQIVTRVHKRRNFETNQIDQNQLSVGWSRDLVEILLQIC